MTVTFTLLITALAVSQMLLPRHWSLAPLLICAFHLPNLYFLEFGGFAFTPVRLIILVALGRAILGGHLSDFGKSGIDVAVAIWGATAIISGSFHKAGVLTNVGVVYNTVGAYLCARAFMPDRTAVLRYCKILAYIVIPLAVFMAFHRVTDRNPYTIVGAFLDQSEERYGRIRASGPFAHAILAGTAAAAIFPLLMLVRESKPKLFLLSAGCCLMAVFASNSSGPISTFLVVVAGLVFWRYRSMIGPVRTLALIMLVALHFIMSDPVWYLMARIDFTGGSTGWHRARLMSAAFEHFSEWALLGTDYTRHWMPTGVSWSPEHTDITNEYLVQGVAGGVPLILAFVGILYLCFRKIGEVYSQSDEHTAFVLWVLGVALFSHAITFFSVGYFDQIFVVFYSLVAAIATFTSACEESVIEHREESLDDSSPLPELSGLPPNQ